MSHFRENFAANVMLGPVVRRSFASLPTNRLRSSQRCFAMAATFQEQNFGPYPIKANEQFAQSKLSFAFVNLKPIVEGHVLVSPRRVVPRFTELSLEEVADLWQLAQRVGSTLEQHLEATALTLAIQDGETAGQSVPHVHVHCLPRRAGDFKRNDDVYDALDAAKIRQSQKGEKLDMDAERKPRSREEMASEAQKFRAWFES